MLNPPMALHATHPTPSDTTIHPTGTDRIIRKKELALMLGVSDATIYRWVENEGLPSPIKLGKNSVGWRLSEVNEWLNSRERGLTSANVKKGER